MGIFCSTDTASDSEYNNAEKAPQKVPNSPAKHGDQYDVASALDDAARARTGHASSTSPSGSRLIDRYLDGPELDARAERAKKRADSKDATTFVNRVNDKVDDYHQLRNLVVTYENALSFDHNCATTAKKVQEEANEILQRLKKDDVERFYDTAPARRGYHGQEHRAHYGDHFLTNADIIEKTQLFRLCRAMPKGAHLHIHFNANLLPHFLLDIAATMSHMYIWSDTPLVQDSAFQRCRIQFSIMSPQAVLAKGARSLFDPAYPAGKVMRFQDFREAFARNVPDRNVDTWLQDKLVFQEEEAHNSSQTSEGAWEKFNARTQMMKGLFNYKTAYIQYTKKCLEDFADDNIQYAEIRPNFMSTNQVWEDDGSSQIDNVGIMNLIIDQYEAFQEEHKGKILKGLKIIYCTPRSFNPDKVEIALDECLAFKKTPKFAPYIAGFDLVGEEGKGKPLKAFVQQFIEFQEKCAAEGVEIPFLFHCGETLDVGTETDGNLIDALLLGSKRIGHGFALPRHPYVQEQMKRRNVCVEVCPISNEILGLTPRINGHAVYSLLANNVHCTISTDNGTLFRSRLSHDFYQVMAGKSDMTLHGLRQLVEWSLEHSCMEPEVWAKVYKEWEVIWDEFCARIVRGDFTLPAEDVASVTSPISPTSPTSPTKL